MYRNLFAGIAAIALTAAAHAEAPVAEAIRTADGMIAVSWTLEGPVDVFVAHEADAGIEEATPLSMDDEDRNFTYQPAGTGRPYFLLRPEAGAVIEVAERVLPLEGGRNFRDLGGYRTADGQSVKWGRLYRSGAMHELTAQDYQYLADLDIAVICDFRANSERAEEPTEWAGGPVEHIDWDYEMDTSGFAAAFAGEMSPERSAAAMTEFYRQAPTEFAPRYAVMFERLAAGDLPLAFHCTAGKDRTGVAAGLILTALGVPRETILADYAMSDDLVDYMAELREEREAIDPEDPMAFWAQLPEAVIAPFMASDPAYLQAALEQIEADHGSVEAYLLEALDVSEADLAAMRSELLE
ncbi:tyrosine-protein phosphatase [Maricaulis sp.]|uniref:tyrosine-protein phosphatase n=1 Tax=Maricaulis sp. TaxID=1486257 RepID=UPI001B12A7CC|nr:tyrosine-protein phosphatase [Maricaulis sp.]MBO6764871.1 tyrosine-protein phosphatase [Maricaulis sp.]